LAETRQERSMMDPVKNNNAEHEEDNKTEEESRQQSEDKTCPPSSSPDVVDVPTFSDMALAGFLSNFKLELTHVAQEMRNLTDEQTKLLEKVGEHNGIIQSSPDMHQLATVMDEMKSGMDRLSKLKHEMVVVHDRSEKLRSRAEKLDAFCKNAQKKEDDLVAKMEKPPESSSSTSTTTSTSTTATTDPS